MLAFVFIFLSANIQIFAAPIQPVTVAVNQATGSSTYSGYPASNAIDGSVSTIWHDNSPSNDGYISLRLTNPGSVNALSYLPRQDTDANGVITSYEIWVSYDNGSTYSRVYSGIWAGDRTLKFATFPTQNNVTHLRLQNRESISGYTSAAEIILYNYDGSLPVMPVDTVTQGNWAAYYGSDGYVLCAFDNTSNPNLAFTQPEPVAADRAELPDYVDSVSYIYASQNGPGRGVGSDSQYRFGYYLTASSSVSAARITDKAGSVAAKLNYRCDDRAITVNINVNNDKERIATLYFAESNRFMRIDAYNQDTGLPVSAPLILQGFQNGQYVTVPLSGSISIVITNMAWNNSGGYSARNAVLSGIFFDSLEINKIAVSAADGDSIRSFGEQVQMSAIISPDFISDKTVAWSVSDIDGNPTALAQIGGESGLLTVGSVEGVFRVTATHIASGEKSSAVYMVLDSSSAAIPATTTISGNGPFSIIENSLVKVVFNRANGTYSAYSQENGKPYVLNASFAVNGLSSTDFQFTAAEVNIASSLTSETIHPLIKGGQGPAPETVAGLSGKTLRLTGAMAGSPSILLDVTLQDSKGSIILRNGIINSTANAIQVMDVCPLVASGTDGGGIFVGPNPITDHCALSGNSDWGTPSLVRGVGMSDARNNMILSYRNESLDEMEAFSLGGLTTYEFRNRFNTSYNTYQHLTNRGRTSIDAKIQLFDSRGKLVDGSSATPYMFDQAYIDFVERNPYDNIENFSQEQARAMSVKLEPIDKYFYETLWYIQGGHKPNPDKGWGMGGGVWYENTANFAVDEAIRSRDLGLTNYAIPNIRVEPDIYTRSNEQLWWNDAKWKEFGHLTDDYPTLKSWIDAMRAVGGEGGLYCQPTYRSDDYCQQYPEHMLGNDPYNCADYTDAGFIAHLENNVYPNMRDSGLGHLMYDYSGTFNYRDTQGRSTQWYAENNNFTAYYRWRYLLDINEGYEDPYATAVSAYRNIFAIPKNIVGNQFHLLENVWMSDGDDVLIGLIDSQRCATDDTSFELPLIRKGIYQWYKNRTLKMVYPDAKLIDQSNADIRRGQVTGMALMFGKPTLAMSLASMSPESIYDFSRTLPMPNNCLSARPLGLFDMAGISDLAVNVCQAYDYQLPGALDDHILLLWNHTTNPKAITVDLGKNTAFGGLGLDKDKTYQVWDFWNWRYVGSFSGDSLLTQGLRRSEAMVLAVREQTGVPQVLSTNRHILQGLLDVRNVEFDSGTGALSGTFDLIENDEYRAIISLPDRSVLPGAFELDSDAIFKMYYNSVENYIEVVISPEINESADWTMTFSGDFEIDTPVPDPVANLTARVQNVTNIFISWDGSIDEMENTRYMVYRGLNPGFLCDTSSFLRLTEKHSYVDDSCQQATVYYYKVIAINPVGMTSEAAMAKAEIILPAYASVSSATASSRYQNNSTYDASRVLTESTSQIWHTNDNDPDMWIVLQLTSPASVIGVDYLPRQDSSSNGTITKFDILVSTDGGLTYERVYEGRWPNDRTWKYAGFDPVPGATHVKIKIHEGVYNFASAARIRVFRNYDDSVIRELAFSSEKMYLSPGDQQQLKLNISPSYIFTADVDWSLSGPGVLSVDSNGVLTAVAEGEVKVTATLKSNPDVYAQITVSVANWRIKRFTSDESGFTVNVKQPKSYTGEGVDVFAAAYNQKGMMVYVGNKAVKPGWETYRFNIDGLSGADIGSAKAMLWEDYIPKTVFHEIKNK